MFDETLAAPGGRRWLGALLLASLLGCGPTVDKEMRKAASAYDAARYEEAVQHYEAAIALAEEEGVEVESATWVSLGRAYEDMGEPAKAVSAYRRATAGDEADPAVFFAIGRLQEAQGDLRSAAASYRSAVERAPDNDDYLSHLQGALEGAALWDEYATALREIAPQRGDGAARLQEVGRRYLKEGHTTAGVIALEGAQALAPGAGDIDAALGEAQLALGRYAAAAESLGRAAEAAPRDVELLKRLGEARLQSGDAAGALRAYRQALDVAPGDLVALSQAGLALHRTGDSRTALTDLQAASRKHPSAPEPYVAMARVQLERGQIDGAMRAAEAARSLAPDRPDVSLVLGLALLRQGKAGAAVAPLKVAREAWPHLPEAAVALCDAERGAGKLGAAVHDCKEALELAPEDRALRRGYADLLLAQGDLRAGLAAWEALAGDPAAEKIDHISLTRALLAVGAPEEAMATVRRAQTGAEGDGELTVLVGLSHAALMQPLEAERAFKRALEQAPRNAFVEATVASWQAADGRVKDARAHLEAARVAGGADVAVRTAAALVQIAAGETRPGVSALEALAKERPGDLWIQAELAGAYERLGRDDDARAIRDRLAAGR